MTKPREDESPTRSSQSSIEEGEIREKLKYVEIEDWDEPTGKRKVRTNSTQNVSKQKHANNLNINENENTDIKNLDNYIEKRVLSLLRDSKINEVKENTLREKIKIEISNKESGVVRNYKLNSNTKFEVFEDFFMSELKTKKLDYAMDLKTSESVDSEKLKEDKHKIRDILINHIDLIYYNRILDLKDPREIMNKLKEYKRLESRTNSISANRDIYNMKFKKGKETVAQFWQKFEENIRTYENIPDVEKLGDKEKRDLFLQAVVEAFPGVNIADSLAKRDGKELSYLNLKDYVLQVESTTVKAELPIASMYGRGFQRGSAYRGRGRSNRGNYNRRENNRECYTCHKIGHVSKDCQQQSNFRCFECKEVGDHIAKNCPSKRKLADNETEARPAKFFRQENNTDQAGFSLPGREGPAGVTRGTQRPRRFRGNRGYRGNRGRGSSQGREGYRAGYSAALEYIADVYEGNINLNSSLDSEHISMFRVGSKENTDSSKNIIAKFIADSGATEHLSKSLLFFDSFNETNKNSIKCANKESSLNTTGMGEIKAYANQNEKLVLKDVLYSKDLTENLLSLRQFVDKGLKIFLDNEIINIYDPIT